jgi:hypothetical protein
MKRIILTLAVTLLIGITAVNAQTDETGTRTQKSQRKTTQTKPSKQQDAKDADARTQWQSDYQQKIGKSGLPSSVIETLNSVEYTGWENASIYRNKSNNEYMLVISDGERPKTLYFDQEGKAMQSGQINSDPNYKGTLGNDPSRSTSQGGEVMGNKSSETPPVGDTRYRSNTQGIGTGTENAPSQIRWTPEERVQITRDQVPPSLRVTLGDKKYKGWEKSTIYRKKNSNEYLVVIDDGNSAKLYYFDRNGKEAMPDNK